MRTALVDTPSKGALSNTLERARSALNGSLRSPGAPEKSYKVIRA